MNYVSLSFLETLQGIFKDIFQEVLSPVLQTVFREIVDLIGDQIWSLFSDIFLDGFLILLKAVNFLDSMFSLFSGLSVIRYNNKKMTLLTYFFQLDGISKALVYMTVLGAIMAFMFSIYSTGKIMADAPFDDRAKPISTVLKNGFKSMITFMIVPFLCVFILELSSALLNQIIYTFQVSSGTSGKAGMDDALFITAVHGAEKNSSALIEFASGHKYQNLSNIKKNFDISKINYLIGYVSSLLVILILATACLTFIRRVFELLLLYLVSPFFSASIALDGGAKFAKWREVFIAKFFAGFGSIFIIKLYLLIVPFLMGNTIKYSGESSKDICIKLFLVIGGAWAVFKGQNTFLSILSPDTAAAASQSSAAIMAMATGGARGVRSAASKLLRRR